VNGAAAGVGLAVACFADIRFAVTGAKLTTAAPKLGFPAEYGLSWLLPRLVGAGRAADWLLSGRVFRTDEAGEAGLFSAVLPPDELDAHAEAYVDDLAHHVSPASVAVTKRQLWTELLGGDPATSVRRSMALLREMATGPDFTEGTRALAERRPPEF
jgi:enoyl-CoA hydratase/carnithine racemase